MYSARKLTLNLVREYFSGLMREMGFWDSWFLNSGNAYSEDYKDRVWGVIDISPIFVSEIDKVWKSNDAGRLSIVDIGSGPISVLNDLSVVEKFEIDLVSFDPLATRYSFFIDRANTNKILVKPRFGFAESLVIPNGTNLVYFRNSLDHSHDAILGLINIFNQMQPGSRIFLDHQENEAQFEKYDGTHHWNFTVINEEFIIWSREISINISQIFKGKAHLKILKYNLKERVWIFINIEKLANLEKINYRIIGFKYKALSVVFFFFQQYLNLRSHTKMKLKILLRNFRIVI